MRPLLQRFVPALCSAAARAVLGRRAVPMALRPAEGAERAGGDARSAAGAAPEHGERRGTAVRGGSRGQALARPRARLPLGCGRTLGRRGKLLNLIVGSCS